jgi:hypothetical protein
MKRKIVWGKVKHSCYFSAKISLKFISTKNKVRDSFCPVFHATPFSPTQNFEIRGSNDTSHTDYYQERENESFVQRISLTIESDSTFVK